MCCLILDAVADTVAQQGWGDGLRRDNGSLSLGTCSHPDLRECQAEEGCGHHSALGSEQPQGKSGPQDRSQDARSVLRADMKQALRGHASDCSQSLQKPTPISSVKYNSKSLYLRGPIHSRVKQ